MPDGISAESIREQVDRIMRSEGFARSERLRRFLKFTVECVLEGKSAELKEYSIGIEVHDKDASFDPRMDTSVRVDARRLRAALLTYYTTAGQNDPIVIEYPKGSYAPTFQNRLTSAPQEGQSGTKPTGQLSRAPLSLNRWKRLWFGAALSCGAAATIWAIAAWRTPANQAWPAGPITSIAVLPFADMSPQKDEEYFCDGLTEELIHALTKVEGLRVVARTSAFQFKQKPADIRLIGQQLKVGVVLEGSVRKEDQRLRITVQLNSAADGYHLWSETYEREAQDVFTLQEEIAGAVVRTLKVRLGSAARQRLVDRGSENLEAHNLYLKGRYYWGKWTVEGWRKSIACYEEAIAIDPRYALAYVGLADVYGARAFDGDLTPNEGDAKKKALLVKAFDLDDRLSQAYTSRAMSRYQHDYDQAGAEQDFQRAIEIDSKDPYAREQFALALISWGRFDDARRQLERAQGVDPLSVTISHKFAVASYFARQYDRAIEEATKSLDMDAPYFRIRQVRGSAYLRKKMYDAAIADFGNAVTVSGERPQPLGNIGYAYAVAGKKAEADNVLAKLRHSRRLFLVPLARIYLGLGETGRALDLLEKAYEDREGMLIWLRVDPVYDPLRDVPRFQNLLKKMTFVSR